jgi:hypothetical protein
VIVIVLVESKENKKLLAQIYNEVSKELFGVGTTLLKVTMVDNIINFQAKHRRAPRSDALEGEAPSLKMEVDFRMSVLFKKKLKEKLMQQFDFEIEAVLRDYDAPTQLAFTNIVLKEK